MEQLQHVFALLKKEWAAYIARLKKGSLVDIAILVTAALLAVMLLAILIFSLLGKKKPDGLPSSASGMVDAVESDYDKDANKIVDSEFDGTILPETEDAGEAYIDNTLFIGDSNTYRMEVLGKTTWQNNLSAVGMGIAVTFVMGLASAVCYVVDEFVLGRFGLDYMQTVAFILVIAALVQFIEMFLQKSMPSLYTALGIYLPLITTNCAVLGVVLLNVQNNYNFIESVVYGVTGGLGFLLAIVLFASIRERLVFADYPKAFEGFPIALVTAGLMALAFMGFSGLKVW